MTTVAPLSLFDQPLRVAVVGSRDYPDLGAVRRYVRTLAPGTLVVSGGARGVDRTAEEEARACGLPEPVIHKPEWGRYGSLRAPRERNKLIARGCDMMVAFWDGKSTGTQHALECARALGKPVEVRR